MNNIKLEASNAAETRVLRYLQENASAVLAEKINAGKKTLAGALEYAKDEAKALARGSSCVCVDDDTVFGWIVHYFEEDHIKDHVGHAAAKKRAVLPASMPAKPEKAVAKRAAPVKQEESGQLTMFDALFAGGAA